MKGNVLESIIGAIVLSIASFFIYFAYVSSGEKIKDGYTVTARFEDVSGLSSGSDVKLNGIKIGAVRSLRLGDNYQAIAEIVIKDDIKIPRDSSAAITTDGIMGNKFVAISAGFDEGVLSQGDEIEITSSSVNFEGLLNKFVSSGKGPERKEEQ
jgi:phospholipid/cholesterol/gamma-HCH transport system substrate-binding protein